MYKTQDVCHLFNISHQTVKNWSKEFVRYLSPGANPSDGRTRIFTEDDLRVFALVNEYRKLGKFFEDSHAALAIGQRVDIPSSEIVPTATPAILAMQERINQLESQLTAALEDASEQRGMVKLLKEQLDNAQKEIKGLYRELAQAQTHIDDD